MSRQCQSKVHLEKHIFFCDERMLTSKVIVVIFALIGNLARCSCWDRATNERYFDGAVFVRHKSVLKTDIIRKMKIISEIKCSQACLSENSCVAHTYCRKPSSPDKGTCYLHQNGIPEGEASVLDKNDECIYQQYIGFIVSNFYDRLLFKQFYSISVLNFTTRWKGKFGYYLNKLCRYDFENVYNQNGYTVIRNRVQEIEAELAKKMSDWITTFSVLFLIFINYDI